MKQQKEEKISQKKTQEKKFKKPIRVVNIKYFFEKLKNENRRFACSRFSIKKKGTMIVSFNIYKKIVKTYLKIYCYEFFFSREPLYFFLGGKVKKVIYPSWKIVGKKAYSKESNVKIQNKNNSIGFFWFKRPSKRMYHMLKLLKARGKTNSITLIEKEMKPRLNLDIIPIFTKEIKRIRKSENLFNDI